MLKFKHYCPKALIEAIELVMKNNRMKFGDIFAHQTSGIAMGMSPAPTIANLFVAIHEAAEILDWLHTQVLYLKRFIDDGIGIWIHHMDPHQDAKNWTAFKSIVNNGGLTWEFTPLSKTIVFMDMTISIDDGRITTALYAKPLALYLYIPPHSCHAPGVNTGLIFGQVLRIHQLCSKQIDINKELALFMHHLADRGYPINTLTPLFAKAIENAKCYISQSETHRLQLKLEKRTQAKTQVFYHLPYHHDNPPSSKIQRLWRQHVSQPTSKVPLHCLNVNGTHLPIRRMIVCYSRAPNLGNKLSYRKICQRKGLKVSSYL